MTTDWTDRLSEYLDGTLTPAEREACDAWLAADAEGRALLAELRRVVEAAASLPDRPVPESVWSGVAAAIRSTPRAEGAGTGIVELATRRTGPTARRWAFTPVQFAAAAAILLAVGIGGGLALRPRVGVTPVIASGPRPGPTITTGTVAIPVASRAQVSYDRAVQELQGILDRNRSTLDTSTVRVLESSLAKIDAALNEAQAALAKDPQNTYLMDHLTRIKRKKLDLLRQGASLVQAS
ncbi:MAG TPA: zf-HC2 domain-containing protein [Gemmatimonadales bacterium]|nr:zf-HC2 domain-containing protein [Gemmatimonadales bacterium]